MFRLGMSRLSLYTHQADSFEKVKLALPPPGLNHTVVGSPLDDKGQAPSTRSPLWSPYLLHPSSQPGLFGLTTQFPMPYASAQPSV